MTYSQKRKCESIIDKAKMRAGLNGSNSNLKSILTDMIVEIGYVFGYDVRGNIPSELKVDLFAYTFGSSANTFLAGLIPIPGVKKGMSHLSASCMPDDVGKHAMEYFDSL
ncbi:MAG: hypothetical protein NC548_37890 [Lachnospiraceae bacterium]|nr:hypothetical protein [Lachnospiraceae bacterium]MCM1231185.1 hypothetical protein [Ruminococcus flavefaciens]